MENGTWPNVWWCISRIKAWEPKAFNIIGRTAPCITPLLWVYSKTKINTSMRRASIHPSTLSSWFTSSVPSVWCKTAGLSLMGFWQIKIQSFTYIQKHTLPTSRSVRTGDLLDAYIYTDLRIGKGIGLPYEETIIRC